MSSGGKREGAGAPPKDPQMVKVPVGYKLPRWLVEWLRGQDVPAAQLIEDALRRRYKLRPPHDAELELAAVPPEPTFEGEKMQTSFEKLPAVEGSVACLTCGCGARSDLSMERMIAVGFGSAGYSRDGVQLWDEGTTEEGEEKFPTVADVEELAKADPDHDWRIFFFAPLYESEYQRQGDGVWVLVRKGMGFA